VAYSGTLVVGGQGVGVAVATGVATELGRVSGMLGTIETLTTPLVRQMNQFARQLTGVILVVSAIVFGYAVVDGHDPPTAFMVMVGLAVAAIPEGLPAVMTITLAIGVQRMAARHAIIRRLPAVETLGAVSVICSDKTGTLTRNEMTVRTAVTARGIFDVTGAGYEPHGAFQQAERDLAAWEDPILPHLARAALLCNDAVLRHTEAEWTVDGDPMEGALVAFAIKAGEDADAIRRQIPRSDEIPFDAAHRFMATLHHAHTDGAVAYVKGAPERILAMCDSQLGRDGRESLDHAWWSAAIDSLGGNGQRVLALARRRMPVGTSELSFDNVEHGLTVLGLLGLIDPPREEAIAAIAECHGAGIAVKMITGDHAVTAGAIGRQLGLIDHGTVVTGQTLDALDDDGLRHVIRDTGVFARTTPEHKLRIVSALQAGGGVVAMTGDGVNDAPALKRADVGVAMGGNGTEAAKEAAEMVLADDNFASIVAAVREGRTVYDNLKKVIGWTLPTNGGESLFIIAAVVSGATLPITAVQILWINMVTAITLGLALAFEPTEPTAMRRPPRAPTEPLLSGLLIWRVVLVSVLFVIGAFGMFEWAQARGMSIEEARTIVVNTIVVMEIFYLFSVRYLHMTSVSWQGILGTPAVLISVAAVTAAQFAFTYVPVMNNLFGTRPLSLADGLVIVGVGLALLAVLELEKQLRRLFRLGGAR
jgi:magnesium-transporting ATPase (P-type)